MKMRSFYIFSLLAILNHLILPADNYIDYSKDGFQHYQTFDEFVFQGIGVAAEPPSVYVKNTEDSIIIVCSSLSENIIYKRVKDMWHNRIEINEDKKRTLNYQPPRTYNRYICNGKVYEFETIYSCYSNYSFLFIKDNTTCKMFDLGNLDTSVLTQNFKEKSQLLKCVDQITTANRDVKTYYLKKEENMFKYINKLDTTEQYLYMKTNLGIWGMQPGLYEKAEFFINKDGTFDSVEQMPQYSLGHDSIIASVKTCLIGSGFHSNQQHHVIRLLINRHGDVTDVKYLKPMLNYKYRKTIENMLFNLPGEFTPGRHRGINVSVWYTLMFLL